MICTTLTEWHDRLGSTNDEARTRVASLGADECLWVAARQQTAGRGRRGRVWQSDTDGAGGDLTASAVLPVPCPLKDLGQVSFVTALAVRQALVDLGVTAEAVRLKWPNDVLIAGQKVAGILLESGPLMPGINWLVVGVGINLATHPTGVDFQATHVGQHAPMPTPEQTLPLLAEAFAQHYNRWRQYGFVAIGDAWEKVAWGLNAPAIARLGTEDVQGTAQGLDETGALVMRLEGGGVRKISAGEVFFSENSR